MEKEIDFLKYKNRGAYHWNQVSTNIFKRNSFVSARYQNIILLLKQYNKLKNLSILDAGCGDGVLSYLLYKKEYNVYGIDLSEEAILYAKEKTKKSTIQFSVGSVYDLPYEDNAFDIICSTEVIEHLNDPDAYLNELKRVTKKKGFIIISTPIKNTKIPIDKMHFQEWYQEDYITQINSHFPNSDFYYSNPVIWQELAQRKARYKIAINILSLLGLNVFKGFNSKWSRFSLQFSVSKVEK